MKSKKLIFLVFVIIVCAMDNIKAHPNIQLSISKYISEASTSIHFEEITIPENLAEYQCSLISSLRNLYSRNYYIDGSLPNPTELINKLNRSKNHNTFQLFAHGQPGKLFVNGQWLDKQELVEFLKSNHITKSNGYTQVNIYGCNFAHGKIGRNTLAYLHDALEMDFAASDDITGIEGDWELEVGNSRNVIAVSDYKYNLQCVSSRKYNAYVYYRPLTGYCNSVNYVISHRSSQIITNVNQGLAPNDLYYAGYKWELIGTDIIPTISGTFNVRLRPGNSTCTTGDMLADAVLITDDLGHRFIIDNSSGTSMGSWTTDGNSANYKGSALIMNKSVAVSGNYFEWSFNENLQLSDTDGDGLIDECDLDDDNDGITDLDEDIACAPTNLGVEYYNSGAAYPTFPSNGTADIATFFTATRAGLPWFPADRLPNSPTNVTNSNINPPNSTTTAGELVVRDYLINMSCQTNVKFQLRSTASSDYNALYIGVGGNSLDASPAAYLGASQLTSAFTTPINPSNGLYFLRHYLVDDNSTADGQIYWSSDQQTTPILLDVNSLPCGSGSAICQHIDTDADGIPDYLDKDSDNDKCLDVVEAGHTDANGNGMLDGTGVDMSTGKVIGYTTGYTGNTLDVRNKNVNSSCADASKSGEADQDADGITNIFDIDNDNDGILDTLEGKCYQTAVYKMNNTATLAGLTIQPNGGTFNLKYSLASGTAVPGLGNTFDVLFQYSDLNNLATKQDHQWEGANTVAPNVVAIRPETSLFYMNLPFNNSTNESVPPNINPDDYFRKMMANGQLDQLGNYNTTIAPLPTTSTSYITNESVEYYSVFNAAGAYDTIYNGYYGRPMFAPCAQFVVNTPSTINGFRKSHTESVPFIYTAFSNGTISANNATNRGLIDIANASISYCISKDTDGDTVPDYLDLDSDNDGCKDAIEGGASVLINQITATGMIVGQVNNMGIPTLAGSGQTVGASQNNAIVTCCDPIASGYADRDNDNISEFCDIDNDNDGILDTTEGKCYQPSTYCLDLNATLAGMSIQPNGGTFNLKYGLVSGTALPNIGNVLNIPFTYSDFLNLATTQDHQWDGANIDSTALAIRPNASLFYINLPFNNTKYENVPFGSNNPDQYWRTMLSNGQLDLIGNFTTSVGTMPTTPMSYITSESIEYYTLFNTAGYATINSGYYARPLNAPLNSYVGTLAYTGTLKKSHTELVKWIYSAFSDGYSMATNSGRRGLISIQNGTISYCTSRNSDGDNLPDYLDLDSDNDGCPDAIEGTGGFNNNSINSQGQLAGSINGTGVPTVAGNGQNVGTSQDALVNKCNYTNPDFNFTTVGLLVSGSLITNDRVQPNSVYGSPTANAGNPSTAMPVINSTGTYTFVANTPGKYRYFVPVCAPLQLTNCPLELLEITVIGLTDSLRKPVVNPDHATTKKNLAIDYNVKANDLCSNGKQGFDKPSIITMTNHGTASVNPDGTIHYVPQNNYIGMDTLIYEVCDTTVNPKQCDKTEYIITVLPDYITNTTSAGDDYNFGRGSYVVIGNALANDIDMENNVQKVNVYTLNNTNGNFTIDSNGNYSFDPNFGKFGPFEFTYTVCDNGVPQKCSDATIHIFIFKTPNLAPVISAYSGILIDSSQAKSNLILEINNLSNEYSAEGNIVVRIPKIANTSIFKDSVSIYTQGQNANNSDWIMDATSSSIYYILTSSKTINASAKSSLALKLIKLLGILPSDIEVQVVIQKNSAGEIDNSDNSDNINLQFFKY